MGRPWKFGGSRQPTMRTVLALVLTMAAVAGCGGDDDPSGDEASAASTTLSTTTAGSVSTTTAALPQDRRSRIERRLADELDDEQVAATVVAGLTADQLRDLEQLAGSDIETSPALSYTPSTVPDDEVDSLWVFSYGYRFAPGVDPAPEGVPPINALVPGPTNEALAELAADFVAEHPVPIVAQWEVARVLEDLGVEDVVSVEPEVAPDGTVTYLSTEGVAEAGLRLTADAGIEPGHAGVLCFAYHAVRCLMTAEEVGLTADVPEGVTLPANYDPQSGQDWTRSAESWIPIDLAGRLVLAG